MQLNQTKFAAGITAASSALYLACSLFVFLWPGASVKLMSSLYHVPNLGSVFIHRVTLSGAIIGLLEVAVYSFVVSWLFAWIFNRSLKA